MPRLKLFIWSLIESVNHDEDALSRLADSIQTAFLEGNGIIQIQLLDTDKIIEFSNRFELDGLSFLEPNDHFFSFNNPYGACPSCEGYGNIIGIDSDLVIPNTDLSIYEALLSRGNRIPFPNIKTN